MKICAIIQARMTSTRLPGKVLLDLEGQTILKRVIERVAMIDGLDHIVVAIPDGDAHTPIAEAVAALSCAVPLSCIAGSEDNVLERTLAAVKSCDADVFMRVTSDCPFVDPQVSGALLRAFLDMDVAYARLDSAQGYPIGFDTEIVRRDALQTAADNNPDAYEREHATPYIWRRPDQFPSLILSSTPDHRAWRLVVDEPRDYEFAQALYKRLVKKPEPFTYRDIINVLEQEPYLLDINGAVDQKAMIGRDDASE